MEKVEVKGQYTWEDSIGASNTYDAPTKFWARAYRIVWTVFIIGLVISFFNATQNNTELYLLGIVIWAVFIVNRIIYGTRLDRRTKELKNDKLINQEIKYTITSRSITWEGMYGRTEYPYGVLTSWRENESLLLVFYSYLSYNAFPKRMFSQEEIYFLKQQLEINHIPETRGRSLLVESLLFIIATGLVFLIQNIF